MFQKEFTLINQTNQKNVCLLLLLFKDIGCKFEPSVCNKCHNVLTRAYKLRHIAILNLKGVNYRCILRGISKNEAVSFLNNPMLEHKGVL